MIYPYKCSKCNYAIDKIISVKEMQHLKKFPQRCPNCGEGWLRRTYDYTFGLIFKGDGFYKNSK